MVKFKKGLRKLGKNAQRVTLGTGKTLTVGGKVATTSGKVLQGVAPIVGVARPEYANQISEVGQKMVVGGRVMKSSGRISRGAARGRVKKSQVSNLEKNTRTA